MKKSTVAQSTIEYVIIFAFVVGALVVVAWRFKGHVQGAYSGLAAGMKDKVYGGQGEQKK
jgi:hypothetical protein